MPAEWEQNDQLAVGGTDWEQQDETIKGSLPEQIVGAFTKGSMKVGQALLQAPSMAVKQYGFLREAGVADAVLREKDPKRQAELREKMFLEQQSINQVANALAKGAEWHKEGQKIIERNHPEWKSDPPESFVDLVTHPGKLGIAIAESMPLLVSAGILTVAGQPNIAAGLMYVTEGQQAYDQAIQDGASEQDAAITYAVYGTVSAALETMQLQGIIKVTKGSYNALLNRTVQKVAQKGLDSLTGQVIKVAAQEALEEMSQGAWQEITAKMVYGKDIPGGVADFIDRRAQEGYLGAIMSLIPTGAGGVAGAVKGRVTTKEQIPEKAVFPKREKAPEQEIQPINVYRTVSGSRTGIIEKEVKLQDGKYIDSVTGETVVLDQEASRGAIEKPMEVEEPVKYTGEAYRVETGTETKPDAKTAADVVRFEQEELGNDLGVTPEKLKELEKRPVSDIVWVVRKKETAAQYAQEDLETEIKPEDIEAVEDYSKVVAGGEVISEIGPDGVLVLKPEKLIKPPRIPRRKALKLGHQLPKKLGWGDAQRRDFMQQVIGKPSMKNMTPKEMQTLVQALQEKARDAGLLPPEDYQKTIFIGPKEVNTEEFIDEVLVQIENLKDKSKKKPGIITRKGLRQRRDILKAIKYITVGIDNLSIPHLIRKIGGAKEGPLKEIGVTNYRRSIHRISSVFRWGVNKLNESLDKVGVTPNDLAEMSSRLDPRFALIQRGRELVGKSKTKQHTVKLGKKQFKLSMAELLDIYLCAQQEEGMAHIEKAGFKIFGEKTGPVSAEQFQPLLDLVSNNPKAKAFADAVVEIAEEYNAPQLNYTHSRLNPEAPEKLADKKNYWHLNVDRPLRIKGKGTYSISLLENKNILRPRKGPAGALVVGDAFSKFFTVQYAVAEYVGMAEELRLLNMVLNYTPVVDTLESKGYTDIRNNLKQLLEWVQDPRSTSMRSDKLVSKILHGSYRAVLHYSPEVIMSQYMSTGHYAGVVDAKHIPLLSMLPTPKLIKEMLKHNDIVWMRYYAGGQSAELAETGQLDVTLRLLTGKHADLNKSGIAAQLTDLTAFAQGWKLAKAVVEDTTDLKKGIEKYLKIEEQGKELLLSEKHPVRDQIAQYWDAVSDKAEELWDTQPSWDKWNKSINTSQRGIKRLPFLFRSYFEKSLMMLHSANEIYESSDKTATDKAKWAQVYGSVIGSQMATALVRTLIGRFVWRQRKSLWDYIAAMVSAPFTMVSVVGGYLNQVVGNLIRILAGEKQRFEGEPISNIATDTMEKFLLGIGQMADAAGYYLTDEEEKAQKQLKYATRNLVLSVGTMKGIPVRQVEKIQKAIETEEIPKYNGGYVYE